MNYKNSPEKTILASTMYKTLRPELIQIENPSIKRLQVSRDTLVVGMQEKNKKDFVIAQITKQGKQIQRICLLNCLPPQFYVHRQKYVIAFVKYKYGHVYLWNLQNKKHVIYYLDNLLSDYAVMQIFQESGIVCILDINDNSVANIAYLIIDYQTETITKIMHHKYLKLKNYTKKIIKIDNISQLAFINEQFQYDKKNITVEICSIQREGQGQQWGYNIVWKNVEIERSKFGGILEFNMHCGIKVSHVQMVDSDVLYLQCSDNYGNIRHLYFNIQSKTLKLSNLQVHPNSHYIFTPSIHNSQFQLEKKLPIYIIEYRPQNQKILANHICQPQKSAKRKQSGTSKTQHQSVNYCVNYHQIYNYRYDANRRCMLVNVWDTGRWTMNGVWSCYFITQIVDQCDDDLLQFVHQMVEEQCEQGENDVVYTLQNLPIVYLDAH